jgi:hypothetical protein
MQKSASGLNGVINPPKTMSASQSAPGLTTVSTTAKTTPIESPRSGLLEKLQAAKAQDLALRQANELAEKKLEAHRVLEVQTKIAEAKEQKFQAIVSTTKALSEKLSEAINSNQGVENTEALFTELRTRTAAIQEAGLHFSLDMDTARPSVKIDDRILIRSVKESAEALPESDTSTPIGALRNDLGKAHRQALIRDELRPVNTDVTTLQEALTDKTAETAPSGIASMIRTISRDLGLASAEIEKLQKQSDVSLADEYIFNDTLTTLAAAHTVEAQTFIDSRTKTHKAYNANLGTNAISETELGDLKASDGRLNSLEKSYINTINSYYKTTSNTHIKHQNDVQEAQASREFTFEFRRETLKEAKGRLSSQLIKRHPKHIIDKQFKLDRLSVLNNWDALDKLISGCYSASRRFVG